MYLGELGSPVTRIDGIGNAAARDLAALGINSVADILRHYPLRYEDRKTFNPLSYSSHEKPALTIVTVLRHESIRWKKGTALKVVVADETDSAAMLCFGRNFLAGKLPPGKKIWLTGPFERTRFGELQSSTFHFEPYSEENNPRDFGRILPVYSLGGTLNQTTLRRAIRSALDSYTVGLRDELPEALLSERGLGSKKSSLENIHFPDELSDASSARETLIFEELFHLQVVVVRRASINRMSRKTAGRWSDRLIDRLIENLPFKPTADQITSLDEIRTDMQGTRTMSRLLQGEVGSGKTLVAFMACLGAIAAGRQAAFMAPTELLARQHADNAAALLEPLGVRVAFLTGDVDAAARRTLVAALASGDIDLAVGTHALFGSDVSFRNLALAIIDEQHRFGVEQRRALTEKGKDVDILSLSATPIPRTLALTAFGDMDISSIRTMPAGRIPVETHLARMGNESKVYDFVEQELQKGNRAYFVYPLIEESGKSPLKDAENMFEKLSISVFPQYRAALVHSRIDEETKRRTMSAFRDGTIQLLVATSVVEVGVDVPQATCMVVEHAERFGLSALHQLRGRVGRGKELSYCFLVYAEPLTDDAKRRLLAMKESNDGFVLAEEDLKMRGPGDMVGTKQSGFLKFSIADPVRDLQLLLEARESAIELYKNDPQLLHPGNRNLRELLQTCPPFNEDLLSAG